MSTSTSNRPKVSTRAFAVLAVMVCIVLAGVVSYYASSHPDGLNKVANDQGLAKNERQSATTGSPFAGYSTDQVGNDRLSGGLAGVIGVSTVLVMAGGLAFFVRRRTPASDCEEE